MTESPCDFRCGYVSTGLDLWLHVMHEHADRIRGARSAVCRS
jgi:hypothetical protein